MPDRTELATAHALIESSYLHWTGQALSVETDRVAWLYSQAPFALLAHGGQDDPLFIYANTAAQALFEYSWEQIVGLPSRLSAPQAQRATRATVLQQVESEGLVRNYSGLRVSRKGHRFWIEGATLWKLRDATGRSAGLAALIPSWRSD